MDPNAEGNRKRRKGPVDYANEAIKRGQNLYGNSQRIQSVIRLLRGGATAVEGVETAGTSLLANISNSVLVPIFGALVFAIGLTFFVTFLTGGSDVVGGTGGGGSGGVPVATSSANLSYCTSKNYVACSKSQFGLTINGASNSMLEQIYNTYQAAFSSHPNYLALFKSETPTFTFVAGPGPQGAYARASNGNITFYSGFLGASNSYQNYVLIHESGHIIAAANNRLQTNLYAQTYQAGVDLACFDSIAILKTYPISVDPYRNEVWSKIAETFAESLADTLLCTGSGTCKSNGGPNSGALPISNFPGTCSHIVNYIKTKVL